MSNEDGLEWSPPKPPWDPEPEPLELTDQQKEAVVQEASKESGDAMPIAEPEPVSTGEEPAAVTNGSIVTSTVEGEPEPVNMGLESMVNQMVEDGDLAVEEPKEEPVEEPPEHPEEPETYSWLDDEGVLQAPEEADHTRDFHGDDGGPVPPQLRNGRPVTEEFSEFTAEDNGIELDGFFFYRIKATTGITLNGVHYPAGGYWFNEETYEGIEAIDAPFQNE